uniref:ER membrane protein complex subunit 2 n=1 Tax=Spumella elongata TaxID=89044 RepID=A0A7S3M0G9_9STRA|mmetsp:Transcript_1585/g.2577  ORF Transcript_1585/g.2577 Transcript_1585/m.2577 type:complete len:303 (+) Transcript_1585:27-935(+)|eukprot:CAMPEP_0184990350 /NCGR_PEP_ID=MMETSP1098-20130426/32047_1 /TAXON_ID=89044 /ORGANISM="Spumella elongata, Strain CCAP 955/1" /LENGTH=302 /DNA_ID=CAMNT_0027515527 /DNA_START=26 /DNA_END=934 /DNA_ORIENTATION=+
MESISNLIESYDAADGKSSITALKELLKELRRSKLRRPDIVFDNWMRVLNAESGSEVWNLYEQICIAALDNGDSNFANECITILLKKFPNSSRVGRLVGMQNEQCGKYEAALEVYTDLLKKNPANLMVLKRKVCVFKAMGDTKRQIEELNALLTQFPSEAASWLELGEVFLSLSDNAAAAHCFEEAVLLNPVSAAYHSRLAEVYYTLGGFDNFVLARKHYAMSLQNQAAQHNLRALYGVLYATNSAAQATTDAANLSVDAKKSREQELRVNTEMQRWAKEQLAELANPTTNSTLELVSRAVM